MEIAKDETFNQERINIECRYGDHCSFFVDANGVLPGEWGGYEELYDCGPNGEALYEIYYSHFRRRILINEYGFFYNKFSCKKYDAHRRYVCEILKNPNYLIFFQIT